MAVETGCLHMFRALVFVFFLIFGVVACDDEFYRTLGVSRTANSDEIRRAYRRMAREWHPDKNTDSNAQEKFIKINEAYETLSDPKKREDYDRYGQSGAPNERQSREYHFFHDNGFMFFDGMPFQFQSNWGYGDFTTLNFFKKTILPESFQKPYLLVIVSDWCPACEAVQEIWDYASGELKSLGLGTAQVNRDYDPRLSRELGVRKLPDFVGVISGKLYHYTGSVTVKNLKDFVKKLFPDNLVPEVTNSSVDPFLHHWYDNKPRALLFTRKTEPPLQLKIVAFKYQDNVGIGYVQITNPFNNNVVEKFGVEKDGPSFAIFKENTIQPEVLLKSSELKIGTLDEVISENLYLNFPRLSSQAMFETLCPQGRFLSQRRLCVIFFTDKIPMSVRSHSLLHMSKDKTWFAKKVRFVYVSQKNQQPFEDSIKMTEKTRSICKDNRMSKKVVILWHLKNREVKYSWFDEGWCGPKDVSRLTAMLNGIHSGKVKLELTAVVAELNNEHGKGVHTRLSDLWNDVVYYFFHYINWSRDLTTVSFIITLGFVFIISCLLPSVNDKDSASETNEKHRHPSSTDVLGLMQLNSQSQDELIHRAKQSQLVVVLLSDATSESQAIRSPIVQTFADIVRQYSRENIFKFGWLSIPDHIVWCNEVMKVQTFGEIKPGTVLALNGAKKYLSIFKVQTRDVSRYDDGMIFEDSDDEDSESASMVFQEDKRTQKRIAEALGRQLPVWLEKLYEGMLPRVKQEKWPRIECNK